jgi:hypothetical protein
MNDERFGLFISAGAFSVTVLLCIVAVAVSCRAEYTPELSPSTTPEGKISLETITKVFYGDMYRYENDEVVCYGRRHLGLQCKWKVQQ